MGAAGLLLRSRLCSLGLLGIRSRGGSRSGGRGGGRRSLLLLGHAHAGHHVVRLLRDGDAGELEVAHVDGVVQVQVGDVHLQVLGKRVGETLDPHLAHRLAEQTALLHAGGLSGELDRQAHAGLLVVAHLHEVHVENAVAHGMELLVMDQRHALLSIDVELDPIALRGEDELAQRGFFHADVLNTGASVEHARYALAAPQQGGVLGALGGALGGGQFYLLHAVCAVEALLIGVLTVFSSG